MPNSDTQSEPSLRPPRREAEQADAPSGEFEPGTAEDAAERIGAKADGARTIPSTSDLHKAFRGHLDSLSELHAEADEATGQSRDASNKAPQFRIFIVDSGWNSAARSALHDNFHLIRELQRENPIYCLGRERSIELMRRYPALVGKDPIIRVHCDVRSKHRKPGFHGFRLHLGLFHQREKALQALQNFVKFIGIHRDSADLETDMRKKLRQEGLQGAFEIVLHGEAHGVSI